MKYYAEELVDKAIMDDCASSKHKLTLLIRTGDTYIIESVTNELIERIYNQPSSGPPFYLLGICKELSMCG